MEGSMSPTIEEQLRKRILARLDADEACNHTGPPPIVGIMEDVEVYGVLTRRECHAALRRMSQGFSQADASADATAFHPLPKRTRKVLREEPVPGEVPEAGDVSLPLFRVLNGVLEWTPCRDREPDRWHSYSAWYGARGDGRIADDWIRMRHALDLHDNPYRTVEVEIDESDPWGDAVEARSE